MLGKYNLSKEFFTYISLLALLISPILIHAQIPTLVKNIYASGGSDPEELIDVNGTLFFKANDQVHGDELWLSDGTTIGTQLVLDINPNGSSDPEHLTKNRRFKWKVSI